MEKYKILSNKKIKDALAALGEFGQNCLVVVDKNNNLQGTLSDGDLRSALLNKKSLNDGIKNVYQKKPTFLIKNNFDKKEVEKILIKKNLDIIPVITKNRKVIDVIYWSKIFGKNKNINFDIPTLIMAGGRGTRLKPFTNILPKPLIPLNNKPVIEHIIDNFVISGIKNFYISINKNSHQIMKSYFHQKKNKYKIKFIEEKIPLGTAGCIKYLKKNKKDFFVTNCDVIFDINFNNLYDFHKKNKYDFTLVGSYEENLLSYGVCKLKKNGLLKTIEEKPTFSYLANCGLYLMSPKIFKAMPKKINQSLDMNELISLALKKKFRIGTYIISQNSWHDVGQWKEYNSTLKRF